LSLFNILAGTQAVYDIESQSHLMLLQLPEQFQDSRKNWVFHDIFGFFTNELDILPLGLYRMPDVNKGTVHPYVITSPEPQMSIESTDYVYVLVRKSALKKRVFKFKTQYSITNMQM